VTVDREAIENSGYNNLQELLVKLPATGNGSFTTRVNNQDSTANGAAGVSLRGLGADATLVLVNGRRVAISSFAQDITTNFVDINSIPVSAIERIEILKDGASAVYGSDAVAGVVNIVLRNDFDGFEISGSYGATTTSGLDEQSLSAIWGTSSDAGNVTLMFDYFKNSTLGNAEIDSTNTANLTSRGGPDRRSSRSTPGLFLIDGAEDAVMDPACPTDRIDLDNGICRYDYAPVNFLVPEAERVGMMLLGRRDLGANVEVFTEVAIQHNTSISQGAATPLDETAGITVPVTHPNNPAWVPSGATTVDVLRLRIVDAGPRQFDIETDNLRMVLGLRGTVGDWDWEVSGQRARSESQQTADRDQGFIRTDFLQEQINLGNYNPYGGTINSPEVIDAISTSLVRQGQSDLTAFDASITGSLFEMPAGAVRMAAGVEYREESISDVPDDQFQRGLIFGTESIQADGSRDITSVFAEFSLPLHESVELQVAGRYDDYSDFGDTTNPKVALRWAVTDSFALRASWAEGFRAPSLAQIGLGASLESEFFKDTYLCAEQNITVANFPLLDYLVQFGGNPDLSAEESESFNVGAVWRPSDAFNVSVDFWDITQSNKIDEVPRIFIYTENCNDQSSTICLRGTPQANRTLGPLNRVLSGFTNIGEQSAQGIDLALTFTREVRSATMTLGLDYSHLLEFQQIVLDSTGLAFEKRDLTGEYEYPEDRFSLGSNWVIGDWGINTRLIYVGKFKDFRTIPVATGDTTRTVDAFLTSNLQFTYSGVKNTKFALSIDNVMDEEVPFAIGDGDADVFGYVSSQHDPRGRFWSFKTTYSF
jgi:outer membrane receptor for ferrienterochelin and colicin